MFSKALTVFAEGGNQGSRQVLSFVDSINQLQDAYPEKLEPGIDYSLIYYDGMHSAWVVWKNHHGDIQFCGSAAYALSYYMCTSLDIRKLDIIAPDIALQATKESGVRLHIPLHQDGLTFRQQLSCGELYYHAAPGIYFIEVFSEHTIYQKWQNPQIEALGLEDPHGLCLFHWNAKQKQGVLRYFTPWHGRPEDSVTGSVQRYLTPYVYQKYAVDQQSWHQASARGGVIYTFYKAPEVLIGAAI